MGAWEEFETGVSRERYNAFVQAVQREAAAFGMHHRVVPTRFEDGRIDGSFQVFWDDWKELACEWRAMSPDVQRRIHPERWELLKAHAANELAKA
jgi:hypothetical protein